MIAMPAGLPPGLAYLQGLDEVKVGQILELAEGEIRTNCLYFVSSGLY